MTLSEIIAECGDENIGLQNLDQCADTLDMNKGITKITFLTDQPISLKGTEKLGLVIWLDRERVAGIMDADMRRDINR